MANNDVTKYILAIICIFAIVLITVLVTNHTAKMQVSNNNADSAGLAYQGVSQSGTEEGLVITHPDSPPDAYAYLRN
jgi:hypothetical protein